MPIWPKRGAELASHAYAGEPIRVRIDNRDIRGGDKKWQWVKRGVPIRIEIGPRDVAGGKILWGRGGGGGGKFFLGGGVGGGKGGAAGGGFAALGPKIPEEFQQIFLKGGK